MESNGANQLHLRFFDDFNGRRFAKCLAYSLSSPAISRIEFLSWAAELSEKQ